MTPERLAALRAILRTYTGEGVATPDAAVYAGTIAHELLDEVERLAAENAALRADMAKVATHNYGVDCPFCDAMLDMAEHTADCPVSQAAALTAGRPD